MPTPIDTLERRVMTLEVEKAALEREKDNRRAQAAPARGRARDRRAQGAGVRR